MIVVLFVITFSSALFVGVVHSITEEPIREAALRAETQSIRNVLPEFDATQVEMIRVDEEEVKLTKATKDGKLVGCAVLSVSHSGFGGDVQMMVGYLPDGTIYNINVLSQKETPGLGTHMTDEDNVLLKSFQGHNAGVVNMTVRKDGGDVDALTAATISSRAYCDAVRKSYEAFKLSGVLDTLKSGSALSAGTTSELATE
ncbi:MAG: RnfABCDGE type electron transport complex subunit G [Alistipes sp.]|nr:RnfABCDGE type electron transport complex subunit G [Candidatus Alistipes equi]